MRGSLEFARDDISAILHPNPSYPGEGGGHISAILQQEMIFQPSQEQSAGRLPHYSVYFQSF